MDVQLKILVIILSFVCLTAVAQSPIHGTLIDLQSEEPVANKGRLQFFLNGKSHLSIFIDSTGHFNIEQSALRALGDTITLSIGGIDTDERYANFKMINIPTDRIREAVNRIFVTRSYLIPSCGKDCFTVNNKKTYKKKEIIVDNGRVKYVMRRIPLHGISNSVAFDVKYQTDFSRDLL